MLSTLFKTRYFNKIIGLPCFLYLECLAFLSAVISLILLFCVLRVIISANAPLSHGLLGCDQKEGGAEHKQDCFKQTNDYLETEAKTLEFISQPYTSELVWLQWS